MTSEWNSKNYRLLPSAKKPDYTMVRFRKPGHKGETWYVNINKMGGGPHQKNGINLNIPATFKGEVTQHVTGRYAIYTLAEFVEHVKLKDIKEFPPEILKSLFMQAVAFCNKHGFVNVDPRWK